MGELIYRFLNTLPEDIDSIPVLISGESSKDFRGVTYLLVEQDSVHHCFEIRHQYGGLPFKTVSLVDNKLAVGWVDHFYLYDTLLNKSLLSFEVSGYFCSAYLFDRIYYVSDAAGIVAFDFSGNMLWRNTSLSVDGVSIEDIDAKSITCTGTFDPPDGPWTRYFLDRNTGKIVSREEHP